MFSCIGFCVISKWSKSNLLLFPLNKYNKRQTLVFPGRFSLLSDKTGRTGQELTQGVHYSLYKVQTNWLNHNIKTIHNHYIVLECVLDPWNWVDFNFDFEISNEENFQFWNLNFLKLLKQYISHIAWMV